MTPEEARELLALVEGTDEAILQEHMDWKDVADVLETVAGLRYEYAVQNTETGGFLREESAGAVINTADLVRHAATLLTLAEQEEEK